MAGRPRKANKYGGHVVAAEDIIADRLPSLIDNLFALADGVTVQEMTPQGETRVYTRPPDFKANAYLIDRIMGKPTERHELSGGDRKPIRVVMVIQPKPRADVDGDDVGTLRN